MQHFDRLSTGVNVNLANADKKSTIILGRLVWSILCGNGGAMYSKETKKGLWQARLRCPKFPPTKFWTSAVGSYGRASVLSNYRA